MTDGQGSEDAGAPEQGAADIEKERAEHDGQAPPRSKQRWRDRPSIQALRREVLSTWADSDLRENEQTRLPDGEEVHLGGFVLGEVFTPSTVSALYVALKAFPAPDKNRNEWIARLAQSRSAAGRSGWLRLGSVRRSGETMLGRVFIDRTIPDCVDTVQLYLFCATPSLTMIIAAFTLTDQARDLSELLRADYRGETVSLFHPPISRA